MRALDLRSLKLNPKDINCWIAFCELLKTSSLTALILHPEDCNSLFTNARLQLFGAIEISGIIKMNVDVLKLPEGPCEQLQERQRLFGEQRDKLKQTLCGNILKRFQEISQTAPKEEMQELVELYFDYHTEHQQVPRPIVSYNVANYLEEATDKHQAALNLVSLLMFQKIKENTQHDSTCFNNLLQIRSERGCDTYDFAECIGIAMAGSELDLSSLRLNPMTADWVAFCCFFKVSPFTTLKLKLVHTDFFPVPVNEWKSFCDATRISSITGLNVDDFKLPKEQFDELKHILCKNILKRLKEIAQTGSKAEIQELTKLYFNYLPDDDEAARAFASFIVDTDFSDESFGVDNLGLSQEKCDEIKAIVCDIIRGELGQLYQPDSNNRAAIFTPENIEKRFKKYIANHRVPYLAVRELLLHFVGYKNFCTPCFYRCDNEAYIKALLESHNDHASVYILLFGNRSRTVRRYTSKTEFEEIEKADWLSGLPEYHNITTQENPYINQHLMLLEQRILFENAEKNGECLGVIFQVAEWVGEVLKNFGLTALSLSALNLSQLTLNQCIIFSKIIKAARSDDADFKVDLSNNKLWQLGAEQWGILFTIIEHLILNNNSLWKLNDAWWNDFDAFITAKGVESLEPYVSQEINQIPQLVNDLIDRSENKAQALKNLLLLSIGCKVSNEARTDVHLQQLYHFRRLDKLKAFKLSAFIAQALQNLDLGLQVESIEKLDLSNRDIFFDTNLNDERLKRVCKIITILRPKTVDLSGNCLYNLNVGQPTMLVDAMTIAGVETLIAKDNVFSECSDDGWSDFCKIIASSGLKHCVLGNNHFWNFSPAKRAVLFDLLKSENITVECVDEEDMPHYDLWLEELAKAYIKEHGEQAVIDLRLLVSEGVVSSQAAQDSTDFQMLLILSKEKAFSGLDIFDCIAKAINVSQVRAPKSSDEVLPSRVATSPQREAPNAAWFKKQKPTDSTIQTDGHSDPNAPTTTSTHPYG